MSVWSWGRVGRAKEAPREKKIGLLVPRDQNKGHVYHVGWYVSGLYYSLSHAGERNSKQRRERGPVFTLCRSPLVPASREARSPDNMSAPKVYVNADVVHTEGCSTWPNVTFFARSTALARE